MSVIATQSCFVAILSKCLTKATEFKLSRRPEKSGIDRPFPETSFRMPGEEKAKFRQFPIFWKKAVWDVNADLLFEK